MKRSLRWVLVLMISFSGLQVSAAWADASLAASLRHPVALAISPDNHRLYVANRRSGTISVIDTQQKKVISETPVGQRLSDMVLAPGGALLVTDEAQHQLLVISIENDQPRVISQISLSPYPVDLTISSDGRLLSVASLWSRRITFLQCLVESDPKPRIIGTVDLPFPPRKQLLVDSRSRLIAADAFGGRLAIVDVEKGRLETIREFPAHNIRGLALSSNGSMLVVSHQMLNALARTVRNDVHWGLVMSNDLRWLKLDAVLDPNQELFDGGHMHSLGEAGRGGGDPGEVIISPEGFVTVTLSGVNQLAFGRESDFSLARLSVGRRPTALVLSNKSRKAYVANTFDDSISIFEMNKPEESQTISLGPQAPRSFIDQGEMLFYDASLSHDGWMSCNSCHDDGHTNGQLNDNLSDLSFGAPKRVLSLLGVAHTAPYAWTASSQTLPQQIHKSIKKTMLGTKATDEQVEALSAYLSTLEPPPSLDLLRDQQDPEAIDRGKKIFASQKCVRCHAGSHYTTPRVYYVGLVDQKGNHQFNPPSLRGVGHRGPYFHDNRVGSLREVFSVYKHQLREELSKEQVDDLVSFLRSL